jgi:hypothetical protein
MVTPYMPSRTPEGGNLIDELDGDPGEVKSRGRQITELGAKMIASDRQINALVDGSSDMEGDAVDKLRELAEKVTSDLRKGGQLYAAVGPHITDYGIALAEAKPLLDTHATKLRSLWEEYYELSRQAETARGAVPRKPDDDDDDTSAKEHYEQADANAQAAEQAAADKRDDWDAEAKLYDEDFDDWHAAFTLAAKNIKEGQSGKIEDSRMDNIKGALDYIADVLSVAGMVLAVLAIVVGGPFFAIALAVAVAALAVQIIKMGVGDGDWLDLTLAAIGVVPFIGPSAKFISAGGGLGSALRGGLSTMIGRGPGGAAVWYTVSGSMRGSGFWGGLGKFSTEFLTGKGIDDWATMGPGFGSAVDTLSTVWSTKLGIVDMIKSTGGGAWGSAFGDRNPFS